MVGRLVQQQQIRLEKQRLGEGHAHPPAAGIFAHGAHLRRHVKAQAGEHRGGARRRGIGADGLQPVMDFGRAVSGGGLRLQQQGAALQISRQHGVEQIGGTGGGFLRHIAHAGALSEANGTAIGLDLPGNRLEKGGFTGAIAPHQADFAAGIDHEAAIVQQGSAGHPQGHVLKHQHCHGRASIRGRPGCKLPICAWRLSAGARWLMRAA